MLDLAASKHSVLREKVVEHAFLTELSKVLLLKHGVPLEILRPEFDANGYDVAIEVNGYLRHVQFKTRLVKGKNREVNISLDLVGKPSGCVIWSLVDANSLQLGPFYWLGEPCGQPMRELGNTVTRHAKPNTDGEKKDRPQHRIVSIAEFTKLATIDDVVMAMFGQDGALAAPILRATVNQMKPGYDLYSGAVGVTETLSGPDTPRQVVRYERRGDKTYAIWIAPSGAYTTGEVPLFSEGDGFYDVFGEYIGRETDLPFAIGIDD